MTIPVLTLDVAAGIPLCSRCAHFQKVEWTEGFWGRKHKRFACSRPRHEPIYGGLQMNSDPLQMRLTGPCGPDGKLYEPNPNMHWRT